MSDDKMTSINLGSNTERWLNYAKVTLPKECPNCHHAILPIRNSSAVFKYAKETHLQVFSWKCPQCFDNYVTFHTRRNLSDVNARFLGITPPLRKRVFSEQLTSLSPRFIEIYHQAASSEAENNLTLAAIGYKFSLEILVKDFAVIILNVPREEISDKSLYQCIEDYLPRMTYIASTKLIQLKGSNFEHHYQKFEPEAFNEFKFYLNALIDLIAVELRLLSTSSSFSEEAD